MHKKMMAPAELFRRLTNKDTNQKESSKPAAKKESHSEDEEGHGYDIDKLGIIINEDMMDIEDDLEYAANDEPLPFPFLLKNIKSPFLN